MGGGGKTRQMITGLSAPPLSLSLSVWDGSVLTRCQGLTVKEKEGRIGCRQTVGEREESSSATFPQSKPFFLNPFGAPASLSRTLCMHSMCCAVL